MKYALNENTKKQVNIGEKYGCLTVTVEPYYIYPPDGVKHRRQHVDTICDCGGIKNQINATTLKRGAVLTYCSYECPIYRQNMPRTPKESKCKIGEIYGKLTVIQEAFYHKQPGEAYRHKCVLVKCECGNNKTYREDKLRRGAYKSCGCAFEYTKKGEGKKRWNHIERTYGLSKDDFLTILESQNNLCAICLSKDTQKYGSPFLHVDHCHKTGKIRGLLCNNCNTGLGYFKDNTISLQSAISYLTKFVDSDSYQSTTPAQNP